MSIDPTAVKSESERIIQSLGGKTLDWLPWLDRTSIRESGEVARRTLAMHGMLQISFGAPISVIAGWIQANELSAALSLKEHALLARGDSEISDQEWTDLRWYLEALWALVWMGGLISELPIDKPVGDVLASLLPNLQKNEAGDGFLSRYKLRPEEEIFPMLDLYYRAHWYARDGQLKGHDTGVFSMDVIMERRKALEWVMDATISDWDDTPDHT